MRTAGRILLSGIGINKSLALSNTTKMPTTRFVNSGGVGQRGRTTFSRYFSTDIARCTTAPRCLVGKERSAIQRGKTGAARPAIIWNAGISNNSPPRTEIPGATGYNGEQEHDEAKGLLLQATHKPSQSELIRWCGVVQLLQDDRGRDERSRGDLLLGQCSPLICQFL
jgi:hypothetical protein